MDKSSTTPPLTPELEHALDASAGVLHGDTYVLLRKDAVFRWLGYESAEELRGDLQPALNAADRGELTQWNVEGFLARMRANSFGGAE